MKEYLKEYLHASLRPQQAKKRAAFLKKSLGRALELDEFEQAGFITFEFFRFQKDPSYLPVLSTYRSSPLICMPVPLPVDPQCIDDFHRIHYRLALYMQLLAANVINPNHIDATIEEVNGLDDIVKELVS
jgi:hypothetical protein